MTTKNWTTSEIQSQKGKTVIITGATSGIGLEAAKVFAEKGASLILPVRNQEKGKNALKEIKQRFAGADVELRLMDVADLDSVRQFAEDVKKKYHKLDLLLNNAGLMWPPERTLSKQGQEIQFATNHLGHFLLTGLLLPLIKESANGRVVTQSSVLHKKTQGQNFEPEIQLADLTFKTNFDTRKAYAQSKLANLLFTYELSFIFVGPKNSAPFKFGSVLALNIGNTPISTFCANSTFITFSIKPPCCCRFVAV
ncbi:MAG: SDR family NAD(P)-dependent oxidoreductase [Cytophagia bacterium]|nr:SDR family NAD(P)-dependent oxidoreductase [Cytophagia bacterium]